MKKKILVFLSVVGLCLFGLFNSLVVNAQDVIEYPDNLKALQFSRVVSDQTHEGAFEYLLEYFLPYQVEGDIEDFDYFFVHVHSADYGFLKGEIDIERNSYRLEEIIGVSDGTRFHFRVTVTKTLAFALYPIRLMPFFADDSKMYLNFEYDLYDLNKIMKSFLFATPNYDDYTEIRDGKTLEVTHIIYNGVNVYLPDGQKYSLTDVPDMINNNPNLFEGYDFIAFYFNLSPSSRFNNADVMGYRYQTDGLAYIIYDLLNERTMVYDYKGNAVHVVNGYGRMVNPRIRVSVEDDTHYRERAYYEAGKVDGIELGKEQGYNEGYQKGYNVGYIKGKNEAVTEQLDLFGYLQALFGEQGLGRLLKLELLPGVSLGAVIMIPLAFFLVSFIMRWFR